MQALKEIKKEFIPIAMEYANKGLRIFPIVRNEKRPAVSGWQKNSSDDPNEVIRLWNEYRDSNIGLPTGENDLFVVDIDVKSGKNGFESLERYGINLPETLKQRTPSGGIHYIYKADGMELKNHVDIVSGVDIRSKGGYIVLSPSTVNGKQYEFIDGFDLSKIASIRQGESLNPEIAKLLAVKDQTLFNQTFSTFELPDLIENGNRNDTLFKYACSLQSKGFTDDYIIDDLKRINESRCENPIPENELLITVRSALSYPKGKKVRNNVSLEPFHKFNKEGEAVKVLDLPVGDHIKENNNIFSIGSIPFVYNNGVYKQNIYDEKSRRLLTSEQYLHERIRDITYDNIMDFNVRSRIMNLIIQDTTVNNNYLDRFINRYPDNLINFKNGMYDVKSGIMLEHDSNFNAINQVPHELDLTFIENVTLEDAPTFKKFLETTLNDDGNIEMLLEYMALSLTKAPAQQILYIKGVAGSGKSLLLNFIKEIIGRDNTSNITIQSLGEKFTNAGIFGKQLNLYPDLPTGALEKGDYLKTIFGGDQITVEQKYKEAFSFYPYVKAIFSMNRFPPYIDEKSDGYYRRVLIINVKNKGEYIESIDSKLTSEIPVILALLIEKLKKVISNKWNVAESESSMKEKQKLKQDTDPIEGFITEGIKMMEPDKLSTYNDVERTIVYDYYKHYCEVNMRKALSRGKFYSELRERGFKEKKNNVWYFTDIQLIAFEGVEKYILLNERFRIQT